MASDEVCESAHLGTATSSVSMNSLSPVWKSDFWTTSPSERVARLPLRRSEPEC